MKIMRQKINGERKICALALVLIIREKICEIARETIFTSIFQCYASGGRIGERSWRIISNVA